MSSKPTSKHLSSKTPAYADAAASNRTDTLTRLYAQKQLALAENNALAAVQIQKVIDLIEKKK